VGTNSRRYPIAVSAVAPSAPIQENATRIIWRLAWPAVALNSLQVVNNLLDRLFIGHLDGSAMTAHGGAINVMFLMFSLAFSLGTGATALVSRAFGAGIRVEYRRASRQAFRLAAILGVLLGILTALLAVPASHAIIPADDPEAIRQMSAFVAIFGAGIPAMCMILTLAGCLRGIGDTRSPMVISGVQILFHILLNAVLIPTHTDLGSFRLPGAGLGLSGAAIAMSASAWMAAAIYIPYVGKTPLGPVMQLALPNPDWARRILRVAIPAAVMAAMRVLSLTVFTFALARVPNGSDAIAAMSIGFAIESIMFMPSFGLSVAAGALVGQSLGAQNPERAAKLGWWAGHWSGIVTLVLCVPIFLGADAIVAGLVNANEPVIREQAALLIRYLCVTEILFAYSMVLIGAMQGAGDTVRPLWITLFSLWGLRVPLAWFLALKTGQSVGAGMVMPVGLGMGAAGAWMAMTTTQAVQGILSMAAFAKGDWKYKKV